ncbi:MAG: Ig-like domain-containing protein [Gemmatimonadales bacterium]
MNRLSGLLGSFGVALAVLAGCGGNDLVLPGSGTAADLELVNGDNQTGSPRSPLAQPLQVKVVDDRGDPLSGHTVAFALDTDAPGARLDPESARSSRGGIAQSQWTLGASSGTQRVVARVAREGSEPLEVQFSAVVAAGAASKLVRGAGDDQSAEVGHRLADPLVVRVTDAFDNPVAGVSVDWAAADGDVDPASSVTGSDGRAQTSWTLGAATGSQSATASSGDLDGSPIHFTATGNVGGADELDRVSGNDQRARPGTALENPLVVELLDGAGNAVPNRAVTWVVATGGGSADPVTSTTDAEGRASTEWTLGPDEGRNTLNAVVSGVGVVAFSAMATNSGGGGSTGASRLAFREQPSDAEQDERIGPPVQVVVLDEDGERVTQGGFKVKLELTGSDNGKLKGHRDEDTRDGVATFDDLKVDREGEYRLRASVDGLPSVDSDAFEIHD